MNDWEIVISESNKVCKVHKCNNRIFYLWGELQLISSVEEDIVGLSEEEVLNRIADGTCDYNELHGFFKLIVKDNISKNLLFVGDNVGSQFFFIDRKMNRISDSLLTLVNLREGDFLPHYESISRFMQESRVYTEETVVEDVMTTDKDSYYIANDMGLMKKSKDLIPFHKVHKTATLKRVVQALTANAKDKNTCAVMTGGTDSRTVLAHLVNIGLHPDGIISGRPSNPDVRIAKQIAKSLGVKLSVYSPDDRSENWVRQGFEFSDGVYDTALSYRHARLKDMACDNEKYYIFGGVGGEFYKNSFCLFLRRRYFLHEVTTDKLATDVLANVAQIPAWYGDQLKEGKRKENEKVKEIASVYAKGNMLCRCNGAGYLKLTKGMSCITNNYARYCLKVDPLMDRDVVAGISNDAAMKHVMKIWQRKEIGCSCERIAKIKTDEGLTCSLKAPYLIRDSIRTILHNTHLVANRLIGKTNKGFGYWDDDYKALSQTDEYKESIEVCNRLGIISVTNPEEIPLAFRGRVVTMGLLFSGINN